jgi:hypothetical protein
MAAETCRLIARGDRVAILSCDPQAASASPRIATVTYVGHIYIRLSDGSTYSVLGLESLRGNENTRIELVSDG